MRELVAAIVAAAIEVVIRLSKRAPKAPPPPLPPSHKDEAHKRAEEDLRRKFPGTL